MLQTKAAPAPEALRTRLIVEPPRNGSLLLALLVKEAPRLAARAINTIAFEAGGGGYLTSDQWSRDGGVYAVPASGGKPKLVLRGAGNPQFGATSDRLFMSAQTDDDKLQLISTDLDGNRRRVHASGDLTSDFEIAPDGYSVAFRENYEAFLTPLLPGTQDVGAAMKEGALPSIRLSQGGADFIHFSNGGIRVRSRTTT